MKFVNTKDRNDFIDKIIEQSAKEFSEEIDFNIMADIFVQDLGYTKIKFYLMDSTHAQDISQWIKDYCKGRVDNVGSTWLFEHSKDAMWFTLKWVDQ